MARTTITSLRPPTIKRSRRFSRATSSNATTKRRGALSAARWRWCRSRSSPRPSRRREATAADWRANLASRTRACGSARVLAAPIQHHLEERAEGAAFVGQNVFGAGRVLRIEPAREDAMLLKLLEARGQRRRADTLQ